MLARIQRLWEKLPIKREHFKRKIGAHTMYLDPEDKGLSEGLRGLPKGIDREAAFMKILRRELKEGMTAVDLGANIGYVTLIMAKIVGSKGLVYAIEPSESNYKFLLKNIEANNYQSHVHAYNLGISNVIGEQKFYMSEQSNLHSMAPNRHTNDFVTVQVKTLTDFLVDKKMPNFIKMDIEGHEVEALEGMVEVLKDAPSPIKILMEVHPMYYSEDHSFAKSLQKMIDIGFNCKYVLSAGVGEPEYFKEKGYKPDEIMKVGSWYRGIYSNVSNEHMIESASFEHDQYIKVKDITVKKIVRAIMIEK
jgi:FkbM family methyltransferase